MLNALHEVVAEAVAVQDGEEVLCDIRSKAPLKSRDVMHKGFRVTSAKAIASVTVAVASNIVFSGLPQYLFGWSSSPNVGLIRFAIIRARIL
jgi:hypothetical protein